MALIPYPDPDELSPDVRASIEHFTQEHGRPTLVRQMLAWFPPALRGIDGLYHPMMTEGRLTRKLKELLFVAASDEHECRY